MKKGKGRKTYLKKRSRKERIAAVLQRKKKDRKREKNS
jgi:hypothetical protein